MEHERNRGTHDECRDMPWRTLTHALSSTFLRQMFATHFETVECRSLSHFVVITVEELQEGRLRSRRTLDPSHRKVLDTSLQRRHVKYEILSYHGRKGR